MKFLRNNTAGIILCILIAGLSTILSEQNIGSFSLEVIGAPVFAILIGMLITLIAPRIASGKSFSGGIKFTSKKFCNGLLLYSVFR